MMACASASTLAMIGSSTSSGSCPRTRDTRSRTSLAAASVSRSGTNSIVICDTSSRLSDLMLLTPSIPEMLSSSGCLTWLSMTCGLAPLYTVRTETTGVSIFGYSRTVRRRNEMTPIRMMSRLITVASTGRRIDSSGRNIQALSGGRSRRGSILLLAFGGRLRRRLLGQHGDRHAVAQAQLAVEHDGVAGREPAADFDLAGATQPKLDLGQRGLAVGNPVDEALRTQGDQRLFRHDHRVL